MEYDAKHCRENPEWWDAPYKRGDFYEAQIQVENAPTIPVVPMSVIEGIKEKIKANFETVLGRYDNFVPVTDSPSYKIWRNSVRIECLKIIDDVLEEYKK